MAFWGRMRCQGDRDFACFINQVTRNTSYYGTLLRMSACFLLVWENLEFNCINRAIICETPVVFICLCMSHYNLLAMVK